MKYIFVLSALMLCFSGCGSDESKEVIPTVTVQDAGSVEGDDVSFKIEVNISLSESHTKDIVLDYITTDGSAFQDVDYMSASGSVTIPAGMTNETIEVTIISDLIKEGNEVFKVAFSSSAEIDFSKATSIVTIINDDTQLPYGAEDYTTPTSYKGWKSSWADEFSGTDINLDWWTHEIGNGDNGWGNNELEYYTDAPENSRIENGSLIIEARDDSWNGNKYTSARMVTKEKQTFQYGRVDIRAKLPFGQGIWPALWMLGTNIDTNGWPACGEIDIMELIGNDPNTSHATVHFGSNSDHKYTGKGYNLSTEIFNDRFHVFSFVWEYNQMWFYVDDILFFEFDSKDTEGQNYPFNADFFFIFNVAIGGQWPGNPDATTQFPQQMVVDYIRVFEKE